MVATLARCAEGFPEFIPSTSRLIAREGTFFDESPALTVVLQAHLLIYCERARF
jgi:hypothetical protein